MIIRDATILDHTELVKSIMRQIEARILNYPAPNKAIAVWVMNVLLNGYVVVAEEDGALVGTIGMGYTHFPWNDEIWIMNNDWLHVDEKYRHHGIANQLIDKVKEFAAEKNIIARFDVINDGKVEKIDKFLEIKGMRYMGGNFIYGLGGAINGKY